MARCRVAILGNGPAMTAPVPVAAKAVTEHTRLRRVLTHPLAHLVFAMIVVGLLQAFIVKLYYVPSGSMEPTLMPGDRIIVNRIALSWDTPSTGDIVVFDAGDRWSETDVELGIWQHLRYAFGAMTGIGPAAPNTLVKRVIATEGQTLACCGAEGRMLVDGNPLDEPYVDVDFPWEPGLLDCSTSPASLRCFESFTVPDGAFVALGDNRTASSDSLSNCRLTGQVDASCLRVGELDRIIGFQSTMAQ